MLEIDEMDVVEECEVAGSIVSLEEEFTLLLAKGHWWLPGRDKQVPGEVVFSHGEEGALVRLFGYPDDTKDLDGFVCGCVHPVRHVALLKCLGHQSQTSRGCGLGTESAELGFIEMWVGDLGFDSAEEIAFESYAFGISNLNVWLNRGCFPPKDDKSKRVEFYRQIFEDAFVRVYLAFLPVQSIMEGASRRTMRHEPCVFIKSKKGLLPYYGETGCYEYYERRLTSFFGLLIGKNAAHYGRCGRADYPLSETVKTAGVVWRLNRRPLPQKLLTPLKREDIFVPYDVVEKELPRIVENYFKLNDEIEGICGRLVYFRFGQTAIPYGGVPELVFMFEGLTRNLYGKDLSLKREEMSGYQVHKANVNNVLAMLGSKPELMNWLSKRLKFNPPKIQELFDWARLNMKGAFFHLDNDNAWLAYTNYLRARRDGFAHSESKALMHDKMYLPAYFWLEGFMMGMVLLKCGVSPEIIRRGVLGCSDFRWGITTYYEEFINGNAGR